MVYILAGVMWKESQVTEMCELCRKNGSAEAVYYIEEKGIREQIITEKEWGILKESKKKGIGGKRTKSGGPGNSDGSPGTEQLSETV